ncbi:hypothetical protein [Litorivivens sp.]|uniref:hypothetical protein n=1 Tax=Litorivivens sp. TaxID=2020868 RepID=UPI003569507E
MSGIPWYERDEAIYAMLSRDSYTTVAQLEERSDFVKELIRESINRLNEAGRITGVIVERRNRRFGWRRCTPPADVLRLPWSPDGLGVALSS